jgi:hypothetical protein
MSAETWPAPLAQAVEDTWTFLVGLRDGRVVKFNHAEPSANFTWAVLAGVESIPGATGFSDFFFGRELHIRVADIMWAIAGDS